MHINQFIDYLKLERNYSDHTITAYRKDLIQFQDYLSVEEIASVTDVNYNIIRGWIAFLLEDGVSARSVNRKMSSIKAFFKFLRIVGELDTDPTALHKSLKVDKKLEVPFSQEEVLKLLDVEIDINDFTELRNQLIIELLYVTGMRRMELIGLKVSDVNLYNDLIKIKGKGSKERLVPLLHNVAQRVKSYINLRASYVDKGVEELFITDHGGKLYPNFVYRVIKSYFSKVSLKVKVSPHILRHSFATHLLDSGADLIAVKELLGHASLASTQVYTHMSVEALKGVYGKAHPRSTKK
jgi:integrase/recombinase XerC